MLRRFALAGVVFGLALVAGGLQWIRTPVTTHNASQGSLRRHKSSSSSSSSLHYSKSNYENHNDTQHTHAAVEFPALHDTQEMVKLSLLVYTFRDETNETNVCAQIQANNFSLPTVNGSMTPGRQAFADLECHWYQHYEHTQVMLVSSAAQNYLAVVFAGTDDLQTSLVDTDVRWEQYGYGTNWTLTQHPDAKVHAGFDHAVFTQGVMNDILANVTAVRHHNATLARLRLYVTGHSLGAAAAVLTSMALVEYYHPQDTETNDNVITATTLSVQDWWNPWSWHHHHHHHDDDSTTPSPPNKIVSLNFGCPRMGNTAYRNYFPHPRLHVWRFVLGWDLVPRLPDFFQHAGHTVQMTISSSNNDKKKKKQQANTGSTPFNGDSSAQAMEAELASYSLSTSANKSREILAYYQHYGNVTLGYAGVPLGWGARPYIWVPGALESHHITRYCHVLQEWQGPWVHDFVPLVPPNSTSNDDDDDAYVNPPFDDFPGEAAIE